MNELLRSLLSTTAPQTILLLGASDTGKTTLIEQTLHGWTPPGPIALVDCDVGQSRLGPPTTVAWSVLEQPFEAWTKLPVQEFVVTGAVSPEGNLDIFLSAVQRIVASARRYSPRVLIDTTGLISGELGVELKQRKLALLRPDVVVALEGNDELAPFLLVYRQDGSQTLDPIDHWEGRKLGFFPVQFGEPISGAEGIPRRAVGGLQKTVFPHHRVGAFGLQMQQIVVECRQR